MDSYEDDSRLFSSALIMAGGSGKRFGDRLKFLHEIAGKPIIKHVMEFLAMVSVTQYICTRYDEMEYFERIRRSGVRMILTEGNGYVQDLRSALSIIDMFPVIVMGGDAIILKEKVLIEKLKEYRASRKDSVSFFNEYGATGITAIRRKPESTESLSYENVMLEPGCVMNINTIEDLEKARIAYRN